VAVIVPISGIVMAPSARSSKRNELLVGPVDLVDEQDGREGSLVLDRLQQRTLDQVLAAEQVGLVKGGPLGLCQADRQQLPRIVPLVQCLGGLDAVVALQPDQGRVQDLRQRLGCLRLSHPGLALEEDRLRQARSAEQRGGQALVRQVAGALQPLSQGGDVRQQTRELPDGAVLPTIVCAGRGLGCHGARYPAGSAANARRQPDPQNQ
jgi:hypothetical protein